MHAITDNHELIVRMRERGAHIVIKDDLITAAFRGGYYKVTREAAFEKDRNDWLPFIRFDTLEKNLLGLYFNTLQTGAERTGTRNVMDEIRNCSSTEEIRRIYDRYFDSAYLAEKLNADEMHIKDRAMNYIFVDEGKGRYIIGCARGNYITPNEVERLSYGRQRAYEKFFKQLISLKRIEAHLDEIQSAYGLRDDEALQLYGIYANDMMLKVYTLEEMLNRAQGSSPSPAAQAEAEFDPAHWRGLGQSLRAFADAPLPQP